MENNGRKVLDWQAFDGRPPTMLVFLYPTDAQNSATLRFQAKELSYESYQAAIVPTADRGVVE